MTDARKYGSKLQAIVGALEEVKKENHHAKVIVFTQWRNLEDRIASVFAELGISHLRLSTCKDLFETRRVLEHFQENSDAQVLFLSLDAHASGTNLTSASHVFLVHPMLAATTEQQAAYERQAIGRAARLGQKDKVTVWRFVTSGTIEDDIYRSISTSSGLTPAQSTDEGSIN
jgi:SNF2 family DNA or RNA helicase